jgi:hypothetical protein
MESLLGWIDTIAVTAGICFLVVRQFLWRTADAARLFVLPLSIIAVGVVSVVWEVLRGEPLTLFTLAVVCAEAVLVFGTGTAMGWMTQFRQRGGVLSYRLVPEGMILWGVFLAIRVGSLFLAGRFGAHLLDTTGAIMVSFGINRLANSLVVRRRIEHRKPVGKESLMSRLLQSRAGR